MDNLQEKIYQLLVSAIDKNYKCFTTKITNSPTPLLGVKVPFLKKIAQQVLKTESIDSIMKMESGVYIEYEFIKGFCIAKATIETDKKFSYLEEFSKTIDNWAVCDSVASALKVKKSDRELLWTFIERLIKSHYPFSVRLGIVLLLQNFADNDNFIRVIGQLKNINCEKHYYIDMAVAWLVSVLLIFCYEQTVAFLSVETCFLDKFTRNKALSKAIESYRIDAQKKIYLKKLKI